MANIPKGQSKRGLRSASVPNRKSGSKPNSISAPSSGLAQPGATTKNATKRFQGESRNRKDSGSASSVPDSSKLTGYMTPGKGGSRSTRKTSANRQRFGVDPGSNPLG